MLRTVVEGHETPAPEQIRRAAKSQETTPPDAARLIHALRQIGYSFNAAVSDLIDNSVSAQASNILVRFITDETSVRAIAIVDDGTGMNLETLSEAMRFGAREPADECSLSKFGMGLKLASLSIARELTVVTRQARFQGGRRWTIEGVESDWKVEVLDGAEVDEWLQQDWSPAILGSHGTAVIWTDLDKLPIGRSGVDATVSSLQRRLKTHVGLHFHRFLEDRSLTVRIDQQRIGEELTEIGNDVIPLNPFGYVMSGHEAYPKHFKVQIPGVGALTAEAHIWPANADLPEYKLGGQAASKQGFYFYRNDRLIQAGGWNGLVQHESEPHSSLARVRIDLPASLDHEFGLNVQKSAVIAPEAFEQAIRNASSDDGTSFDEYRRDAQSVYRRKDTRAHKDLPLVPAKGIPKSLKSNLLDLLAPESRRIRDVTFEWKHFVSGDLFDLDPVSRTIYLNEAYRRYLLRSLRASETDLPAFKVMLFLLVKDDFDRERMSSKRKEELAQINEMLAAAVKLQRG